MATELAFVILNEYSLSTEVMGEARYWGLPHLSPTLSFLLYVLNYMWIRFIMNAVHNFGIFPPILR